MHKPKVINCRKCGEPKSASNVTKHLKVCGEKKVNFWALPLFTLIFLKNNYPVFERHNLIGQEKYFFLLYSKILLKTIMKCSFCL